MRCSPTILTLLLLAGCQRTYAAYDNTSATSLEGECERAAYYDPDVHDMLAKAAGSVNYAHQEWAQRVEDAKRQAVQRCMLARGGVRGAGGVELPQRGPSVFNPPQ